ncbi:MAG: Stk1 family PASTA domain-containing Ser/Thr kinase [Oscillospiraceae bacterium]|nr:Stk1 family PASTA domain-containing Ser/Thr kinase [Oscillospiraceae bacterium]
MDKYTGKRLDARYEIHELIGVGGMAVVYRAYDIIEEKIVAVKILKDEYLGNKEFIRRFRNESKAIAVLCHPNIVKVYDVSLGTKIQYIVMEYINGITLKEYMTQQKETKWNEAVHFTEQILKALHHAHEKGVIHRDIKPQNIMLLPDGTIKVTDFGIARFFKHETQTMTDRAIGSVHYISPEQAKGEITDEKADIYSVGVILYEMTTGLLPFEADNAVSVAIMQMQTAPKRPRKINELIPEGLESITMKAMQKNPQNRYLSAKKMLTDIEKFKKDPSIKFEYKYFIDDSPTKYIDTIKKVKSGENDDYGDNFNYKKDNKNKSKTIYIVGGVAAVVILSVLIFLGISIFNYFGNSSNKDIAVPDFIGMKYADIQDNPDYKFVWKIENVYDPTQEEGIIIDQDPLPNTKKVKEGATIVLKVNSSGVLVTIPSVRGLTEEVAKLKFGSAGIKYEVLMVVDDDTAEGLVKNTDPAEGTKVTADTTVIIYVSKGSAAQEILMPDIIGKNFDTAKNEILSKGLKISESIDYENSDKLKDTVLATNPLPGVPTSLGSTVKVTLSNGRKKEKSFDIKVDLPQITDESMQNILVSVYIDGILDSTKTIRPSYNNGEYTVNLKGTTGKKRVNVDIDGKQYRIYDVDFDAASDNIKKVAAYEYSKSVNANPNNA